MNRKTELLLLALHFYLEWLDGKEPKESKIKEYGTFIRSITRKLCKTEPEVRKYIDLAYAKLGDITKNKEVEANSLALSVNFMFLALEEGYLKGSQELTAKRVGMNLYSELESNLLKDIGVKTANVLVDKYQYKES